ncbi:protease complex subunit PrcB family protein [Lachnospiraceae bacterium ZAX-1]
MKKYISIGFLLIFLLNGCSIVETDGKKMEDIEFTVVEESQIPDELKVAIEEKATGEFKLTFATKEELYIVVGYGTQPTNGYSIAVEELYLSSNAIYINTTLIGPAKGDTVSEVESTPYIVTKMKYIDKSVVFE